MLLYRITNTANGKAYIGVTSRTLRGRWHGHISHARLRKKEGSALYAAIRKHGADSFCIEQIGSASDWPALLAMEKAAIELYATVAPSGYNVTLGGEGMLGWNPSADTRAKMSALKVGKRPSAETLAKRSESLKGIFKSPEWRARLAASHSGKKLTTEHRAAMSMARKGKGPPREHIERLAMMARGRPRSQEIRAKISAGLRARKAA